MIKNKKPSLKIFSQANEFFYEVLSKQFKVDNILISKEVEFYIVDLLSRFLKSENFFSIGKNGEYVNDPLIFLFKEAEDEDNPQSKRLLYRQAGDIALYTVGLLPEKKISSSYYATIGKSAYSNAAILYEKQVVKSIYRELSSSFDSISNSLQKNPSLILSKVIY